MTLSPNKKAVFKELQKIPGVGPSIAIDLWDLGIRDLEDLQEKCPETLFDQLCNIRGQKIDRCVLYVFRLSVYFSKEKDPKEHLLKWWNWKD